MEISNQLELGLFSQNIMEVSEIIPHRGFYNMLELDYDSLLYLVHCINQCVLNLFFMLVVVIGYTLA